MVDAVGSVPVYIDRPMIDDYTGFVAVEAGCYQLSGPEALAWVGLSRTSRVPRCRASARTQT